MPMLRPRQLYGIRNHRIQHGLKVCWRVGNDTQDFAHSSLLLERFGELSIAGLKLLRDAL
jgi:hypothetical protein